MSLRLAALTAASLLVLSLPVQADEVPNMVGTWTGTVDSAVMVGNTPDRTAEPGQAFTFSSTPIDFTFSIEQQQGARFGGKMSNAKRSETLIGHLSPDHKSGMMLDDDGSYVFTLSDTNTMQVCYDHSKPDSKVIACWTAKRAQ